MNEPRRDTSARAELNRHARSVCEEDVAALLERRGSLALRFDDEGPLARFESEANLLYSLVRDYWTGVYPDVAWGTVATAVATLAHVLGSADATPTTAPEGYVGGVDQGDVLSLGLASVQAELRAYERWVERTSLVAPVEE